MNIGATGIILLVLIALLLFGPKKLPELGRAVGRTLKEFKAGTKDMLEDDDKKQPATHIEGNETAEYSDKTNKRLPE